MITIIVWSTPKEAKFQYWTSAEFCPLPAVRDSQVSSIKSSTSVITIIIVITITIGTHELNHINIKVKTY